MNETCASCGGPVTSAGARSTTGRRYCSKRRECRAAKQRDYYSRVHGNEEERVEDRPCSCCHVAMPARPWRVTDSEFGRWCRKRGCQEHKAITVANSSPERIAARQAALDGAARNAKVVECPECGRVDAREGWKHPNPEMTAPCSATGNFSPSRVIANELWELPLP